MQWSDRQGLNVLNAYGDTTGDTDDYSQQINARIAIGKFITSLFGGEGIYSGGANTINEFLNNGKEFPSTSLIINADSSSSVTYGPASTITIHTPGTGYTSGNILTITGGHNNATLEVKSTGALGAITAVSLVSGGTAYSIANGYTTTGGGANNCKINITAIAGEPWFFSSLSSKSINFSVANAAGNTGRLYAQIKPVAGLSPIGASGDPDDFILLAQNNLMSAPVNSILLGSGTISNSAFTSWIPADYIFVDATTQSLQSWTADTHSGSITIYEHDTFNIYGQNGIQTSVSSIDNQILLSANLQSNGGLLVDDNGLSVKIKTDGGLGVDSTGLFVANTAIKFAVTPDIGDNISFLDKSIMTITAGDGLTSVASATDTLTLSLSVSSTGGLEITPDTKLSLKISSIGKLSKDANGLYSQPVSFYISGDSNVNGNVIQTITEKSILTLYGTNSIYTDTTSGTSGRVEIGIQLAAIPGLVVSANALSVLVDATPGTGNETIILDANGLSLASATLNTKYGAPSAGTYATGDFYRDKSGALLICDSGGTPGTWSQLSIGKTYETSDSEDSDDFILPLAASFNGGTRPRGYRIDWVSQFDYLNTYRNTMSWLWYESRGGKKYWASQSEFPMQMGKLYLDSSTENSNPIDVNTSLSYALTPTITANSVSISSFKAFWYSLVGKYDAILIENFYALSKDNPTISVDYTYNPYHSTTNIGSISVVSNLGTLAYNEALLYSINANETLSKRIILATFDAYANEYSHRDITIHGRYVEDQDSVLSTTP